MEKILLVEDEKILADMYQEKLSEAGFEITVARSAEEGLEVLKKERPDLILLDILLPRENGIQLLRELKNNPETTNIRVVAFSNYDDPETKKEAFKLGVEDYLIKANYTPQEIIEKIKKYFEQ